MSEFVYLYRRPPQPERSPQQMQSAMQRWSAWIKELEQQGHLAQLGHPLANGGGVVKDRKGTLQDGPFAEAKDIIAGYSVITAADLQEALALAAGCPVFDQGGSVEVRPILKM